MAPKFKVPKLEANSFKGWTFVLVAGVVLAVVALFAQGSLSGVTNSTGCVMAVQGTAPLDVYRNPGTELGPVETLRPGQKVDAQRGAIQNGFRQLVGDQRWAINERLAATSGSTC
ncbi:hypothetical protein GCM10009836_68000 [Pseudonocardia ailaonensis]|uniref:SH3 domain-containing protein n=1 Tax=Pseudonocardia ailaonensis TaxID=367279 RepID=A0ABN2NNF8_9PSEU